MPRPLGPAAGALILALAACSRPDPGWTEEERARIASLSPLPEAPPSPGNAHADDPAAAALGEALFSDRSLGEGVACADCHQPDRGFTDGLPRAIGASRGTRNTPSVRTAPYQTFLGWDGRWDSVWSQALGPLEDPAEQASSRVAVARAVAARHREAWEPVFGPLPDPAFFDALPPHARPVAGDPTHPHQVAWDAMDPADRDRIDAIFARAGKALEAFQRTLRPPETPFDRYVAALEAGDPDGGGHLSRSAVHGLRVFIGSGQCIACHSGPWLSDRAFHALGLPDPPDLPAEEGRAEGARLLLESPFRCGGPHSDASACPELEFLDPDLPAFRGAWRTPSLRDVAVTAPYTHTGQLRSLDEVIAFYRELPGEEAEREELLLQVDPGIGPELVAFLESLTGER